MSFKEIDAGSDYQTYIKEKEMGDEEVIFLTYREGMTEEEISVDEVVISKNALLRFIKENFTEEELKES